MTSFWTPRFRRGLILGVVLLVGMVGAAAIWEMSRYAAAVRRLHRGVGDTIFYSADSKPWFRLDEQRRDVPLNQIAADLQHAVVAVEDRRFYAHGGIDPIGLARAAVRDVQSRSLAEGGSTLTQQLARTLFLSHAQTFARKAKEAVIAELIEVRLSKEEILELYLNRVYLSAGVYGVEAMSQHLYRKPARSLRLSEAAFIAGLLRAPSALSPWTNYEGALERSHVVLSLMREQKFITAEQESAARRERPAIQPYRSPVDPRAGWAKDYLRQQFRNQFGGDSPPDWQVPPDSSDAAGSGGASSVGRPPSDSTRAARRSKRRSSRSIHAPATFSPWSADRLRAKHVQSRDTSRRQAGSTFKPFVYAAALSNGFTPVTLLSNLDRVSLLAIPNGAANVTYRDSSDPTGVTTSGAAESNNAAAADLQQRISSKGAAVSRRIRACAILPDVPSLALGTGVVTPLDLTAAFSMFPSGGGFSTATRLCCRSQTATGRASSRRRRRPNRVISPQVAFQMVSMLRDVIDRGTGSPRARARRSRPGRRENGHD